MKPLAHNPTTLRAWPRSARVRRALTRPLLLADFHTVFGQPLPLPHSFLPDLRFMQPAPTQPQTSLPLHSMCIRPASAAPAASF
jgi:hypothetical protein